MKRLSSCVCGRISQHNLIFVFTLIDIWSFVNHVNYINFGKLGKWTKHDIQLIPIAPGSLFDVAVMGKHSLLPDYSAFIVFELAHRALWVLYVYTQAFHNF